MEDRTRTYLRGRFRDYYGRIDLTPPPEPESREWGFIPFTSSPGSTMVRHQSLVSYDSLEDLLRQKAPRHTYFSAAYYDAPSESVMANKGRQGSDLIFDIDADHLPNIDPEESGYREMLDAGKTEVMKLLSFLEDDLGFEELTVTFSGGRGYHVHVRDETVQSLDSDHRREIVDYIRGIDFDYSSIVETTSTGAVGSAGRSTPAPRKRLKTDSGWGKRVHSYLMDFVDELVELDHDEAVDRVTEFEGVGEKRGEAVVNIAESNYSAIEDGNLDVHPAFDTIVERIAQRAVEAENAHIDEPVTTDTKRLIRLPGSLHGGSALRVTRIPRDDIEDFEPLVDAVPSMFGDLNIRVRVTEDVDVWFDGEDRSFDEGEEVSVSEDLGLFLMSRGQAEKQQE